MESRKIRYAVVGLGHIAQTAVLPAFKKARANSELVALVSGSPEKLQKLSQEYQVKHCYHYSELLGAMQRGEMDALYIATPNFHHRDIMETAAECGVHVLCEKPLAITSEDCQSMIAAAEKNNIKLMVAYRLHLEPANLDVIKYVEEKAIGEVRAFNSVFTINVDDPKNIRLDYIEKGGGALYDIGIYCINAARNIFQAEPLEVFALGTSGNDERFSKVHECISATLKFPNERLATFTVSLGSPSVADFDLIGSEGRIRLENAYQYGTEMKLKIFRNNQEKVQTYPPGDQFAPELIHFSDCIIKDQKPTPAGAEGLADIKIIEALHLSIDSGVPVSMGPIVIKGQIPETQNIGELS